MAVAPLPAAPLRPHLGWTSWQALALLSFALVAPAALPAGGGDRRLPELRRRQSSGEPILSATCVSLRCAPQRHAPLLARVEAGVPLRVVRQWFSPEGGRWLRVEVGVRGARLARGWLQS
jgi:hypothetical protein